MKCPNCQAELPDNSKFCGVCGQSLVTERKCPQCGHTNPQDYNFCLQCGQPLTEQAPSPKKPKSKKPSTIEPTSFADSRYQVRKLLGEGGKKKVYLSHGTKMERDVTFAPEK
jgi:predicted amidophosphoribosyltransferase